MSKNSNSGTFIFELKPPYHILECDKEFLSLMHISLTYAKAHLHVLSDIIKGSEYEDFVGSLHYQLQRSNFTNDKIHIEKKNGETSQFLLSGQAFILKDKREVLQCNCTDISSLETSALMTEQAISDLEVFSQSVRCGLSKHLCDNSLSIVWANDYFYQLFGYNKTEYEEAFGSSLISMIYPEDLSLVVNSMASLMEDHEIDISFRIKHKTQAFRWVNLIAARIEGHQEDEFPTANFVLNDITKLKLAEMQAELETRKYEIIADISEEIPFEYNIETDVLTYAPKYETIFGRKNIYRHPLKQFLAGNYISEDTVTAFSGIFDAAKSGDTTHSTEYKLKNAKGEYEWHYSTFSLIKDASGKPARAIGIIRNIHSLKQEQESLLHRAQTDSMTGLLNKATTEALVTERLKELQSGAYDVVFLVDIDDFKTINDTYGHVVGDEVIIDIANALMRYTFNDGFVGRIGGDEFLVYLPNILDTTLACEKAEKYAEELRTKYPGDNGKPKVTLSIGIAATDISLPYSDLLERADAALYQTKLNGKNGYVIYDETIERGNYHNERKGNTSNYDPVIISNALSILCEDGTPNDNITKALQYVGNATHIHGITLWKYQKDRHFLEVTFEWLSEEYSSQSTRQEQLSALQWEEIDTLSITGTYHSTNLKAIKLNNFSKSPFSNTAEFIQSKFMYKGEPIGFIGYFNYAKDEVWPIDKIETLNLFTKVLNGYIQKLYICDAP